MKTTRQAKLMAKGPKQGIKALPHGAAKPRNNRRHRKVPRS